MRYTKKNTGKPFILWCAIIVTVLCMPGRGEIAGRRIKAAYFIYGGRQILQYEFLCDLLFTDMHYCMEKAARDLGITLDTFSMELDLAKMERELNRCVETFKPDVFICQGGSESARFIVQFGELKKIPTITMNTGFLPSDDMGKPREKYRFWIGDIHPDDIDVGYRQGVLLSQEALKRWPAPVDMIAFTGIGFDQASQTRVAGLKQALEKFPVVKLRQVFTTRYMSFLAAEKFILVKKSRYRETRVVWTVCDSIALGVARGARKMGLVPGRDIIICGTDWTAGGLKGVEEGDVFLSAGGHYLEGAWTMVLIHDYFRGKDFAREKTTFVTPMYMVTTKDVLSYKKIRSREYIDTLDFKRYSKIYDESIEQYRFDAADLLEK